MIPLLTADGSYTLYNKDLDETYHSRGGALTESEHVFIAAGLNPVLERKNDITLLEVGFGTGLNALLTYRSLQGRSARVHYTAIEPHPLDWDLAKTLNYPQVLNDPALEDVYARLHQSPWNQSTRIGENFLLHNWQIPIEEASLVLDYDLVYFDAFAPAKQPEIWSENVLAKIFTAQTTGGLFVSYSAQGEFKRTLKKVGYDVEVLPGANGKREMTRARKGSQS